MREINRDILVHSCRIQPARLPRDTVVSGDMYIGEMSKPLDQSEWFSPLPKSCRCRKRVSSRDATEWVSCGWAVWILQFKRRRGEVVLNDDVISKIWMPVQKERVPRVDLVTRADIERSVIGSEKKLKYFGFNSATKKFEILPRPEGISETDWKLGALAEVEHDKKIRKQNKLYIQECGELILWSRIHCGKTQTVFKDNKEIKIGKYGIPINDSSYIIRAFRKDLLDGRALFPFGPDMRTAGGHV